jgi:hypothetical protein
VNPVVDNFGRDKAFPIFVDNSDEKPSQEDRNSLLIRTESSSDSETSWTEQIDVDVAHQISDDQTKTFQNDELGGL